MAKETEEDGKKIVWGYHIDEGQLVTIDPDKKSTLDERLSGIGAVKDENPQGPRAEQLGELHEIWNLGSQKILVHTEPIIGKTGEFRVTLVAHQSKIADLTEGILKVNS